MQWFMDARRCKYTQCRCNTSPPAPFCEPAFVYPPYHPRNRYFQAALDSCRLFRDNTVPFIPLVHRRPRSTDCEARGTSGGTSLAPVSVPQLCTRRKMTMNVYRMPYRASKFNELGHPRAPGICARCPAVDLPCRLCRGSLLVRAPTHPHRPLPL